MLFPSPVYLHYLADLVVQMHGGAVFGNIFAVVLVELRGLVRRILRQPPLLHVLFIIQGAQRQRNRCSFPPVVVNSSGRGAYSGAKHSTSSPHFVRCLKSGTVG